MSRSCSREKLNYIEFMTCWEGKNSAQNKSSFTPNNFAGRGKLSCKKGKKKGEEKFCLLSHSRLEPCKVYHECACWLLMMSCFPLTTVRNEKSGKIFCNSNPDFYALDLCICIFRKISCKKKKRKIKTRSVTGQKKLRIHFIYITFVILFTHTCFGEKWR